MNQSMSQSNRTTILTIYLQDILSKLSEIQNFSRRSIETADEASRINIDIRRITIIITVRGGLKYLWAPRQSRQSEPL